MRNNMRQDTSEQAWRNTRELQPQRGSRHGCRDGRLAREHLRGRDARAGRRDACPTTRLAAGSRRLECSTRGAGLLLPGALLVTMGAELLAPFVFVDFCFAPFFQ